MHNISSIQQVGLGSFNVEEVARWYRKNLMMDVQIFSEEAEAALMVDYTGGSVQRRHAILALNKNGGGGLEFWQFKSRTSVPAPFVIKPGDLGISMLKMKVSNIEEAFTRVSKLDVRVYYEVGDNVMDPSSFAFQDPFGNSVQLIESSNWYNVKGKDKQGGVLGVVIGVSDIQKSVKFYKEILGFDIARDMKVDTFKDLNKVAGERNEYNRVILSYSELREGPFAKLLGSNEIELIQIIDKKPRVIFQDRYWGDQGFIHLCFDVQGMSSLKNRCNQNGYPFTVDSADSFDMGKAAGRFAYIEDPDGTLIEFVETHKIPILPQIGWYYNLSKRGKAYLPDWLIKLMFIGSK